MCILFGYHAQIIFVTFFTKRTQSFFRLKLIDTMYLVYATPPTVYSDSFETLHVFRSWTEDAHILGHELLRVLPPPQGELSRLCFKAWHLTSFSQLVGHLAVWAFGCCSVLNTLSLIFLKNKKNKIRLLKWYLYYSNW